MAFTPLVGRAGVADLPMGCGERRQRDEVDSDKVRELDPGVGSMGLVPSGMSSTPSHMTWRTMSLRPYLDGQHQLRCYRGDRRERPHLVAAHLHQRCSEEAGDERVGGGVAVVRPVGLRGWSGGLGRALWRGEAATRE